MTTYTSPLLARPGAVAATGPDEGVAWHYGDPVAEQRALEHGGAVVDQSHLGVVRVAGPDRLSWLHSITSQDVEHLRPRESTELFVLSPQGHAEHAAGVVDDGEATWLITERASAPGLAAWLERMKFMMRVEIEDLTGRYAAIGEAVDAEGTEDEPVTWRDTWPHVVGGGTRYGPPENEHPGADRHWRLVLVPAESLAEEVAAREATGWRLAGTWATEALRIEAWRPRLGRDVDERTIPHELDWLRTAVHLAKGCYRGQETIARVHNLGRPPRRLTFLHLDGSGHVIPEPGAEVRLRPEGAPGASSGKVVGKLTSVARHHELGPVGLAVLKRSVPEDAELLVVSEAGGDVVEVAAAQETVVPGEGLSADRPESHGRLTPGLRGGDGLL
ncbi:YgfZ/GcvT domain-containing protein [Myceligenerans pegani]|uniref:Folate-binding protein YgfZ n=1 Tax=Myceligenerans pegani TaxID=2776917 RepID=A0ABR9MVQ1_9MICO|nr:folate-binding protein YgfZ [Myceligenerans sp. TRM 65318]MBE1875126.1 folate-binding protein YgfZ [Myceligenerans sp. TRM 65318]MBE3017397.1 folate-binding protein YgfZ [Myceligenerans sp. TRM 65318]